MWFADSDVYKTLEAAAWELGRRRRGPELREFIDATAALLAKAQDDDGYLNSYFTRSKPRAALAGAALEPRAVLRRPPHPGGRRRGPGRRRATRAACAVARRFADLLVTRFGAGGVDGDLRPPGDRDRAGRAVPAHRSPAVPRTWPRGSSTCAGTGCSATDRFGPAYYQDHVPVREATEVTGHVVRQLYLLAGVVDVAVETGDAELLARRRTAVGLDAFGTKTYITGGAGLPAPGRGVRRPVRAAAGPGVRRDLRRDRQLPVELADAAGHRRAPVRRRDGTRAVQRDRRRRPPLDGRTSSTPTRCSCAPATTARTRTRPSQRLPWYSCACCPPNLARLMASLQAYLATDRRRRPAAAPVRRRHGRAPAVRTRARCGTGYPWDGRIAVTVTAAAPAGRGRWRCGFPAGARRSPLTVDGAPVGRRSPTTATCG